MHQSEFHLAWTHVNGNHEVTLHRTGTLMQSEILNRLNSLRVLCQRALIQYFNEHFWFKPCGCKVSRWKIQKSFLTSWLFESQWPIIWTLKSSCVPLWLHRKKCSINFSCLNTRLPSPFSLTLHLYWLNQ